MTANAERCLSDLKDIILSVVLHADELVTTPSFKFKWLETHKATVERIEALDKKEFEWLDNQYKIWYVDVIESKIPEAAKQLLPSEWYI